MDLAMFCFPKSQPPDPYNCALVTLQMLRLITPTISNTLIPMYPQGMNRVELTTFMKEIYGQTLEYVEITVDNLATYMHSIIPGFATMLQLSSSKTDTGHSVVYARSLTGVWYLIDPQSGMMYSDITGQDTGPIRKLAPYISQFDRATTLVYRDNVARTIEQHLELSQAMDSRIAGDGVMQFQSRGLVVEEYIRSIMGLDIEMRHGRGRKTRKRKGVYGRRTK